MGFSSDYCSSSLSKNTKIVTIETTLQQYLVQFKDLLHEFEQTQTELDNSKTQCVALKQKCESKTCDSALELNKIIAKKDEIIQSVASTLTKLNETKNLNIINEAFKILCQDTSPLTPPIEERDNNTKISPKKEMETSITEEVSFNESLGEIDGTPTGRTSPIFHTRKSKNISGKSTDCREKKKIPDDWPTPNSKAVKLIFTTTPSRKGSGKLKQSRIDIVKTKQTTVVDLTCSPQFSGGNLVKCESKVQNLIKKESMENDDTILPSPTSGPTNFTMLKSKPKDSPVKFKKPPLSLKPKTEKVDKQNENAHRDDAAEMENSINILNRGPDKSRKIKKENITADIIKMEPMDQDVTHCDTQASISLLQQIDKLEEQIKQNCQSPAKRPLAENINVVNTPPKEDPESSISILQQKNIPKTAVDAVKRKLTEPVEPLCIEETVRKKAEKRALPGWSCDECKNFYGVLYKDDPVMLEKKIHECSKHRGRHNPIRPSTPPNFWNPRWTVPEDTEELNRINNGG